MTDPSHSSVVHRALILDQFSRQAEFFAKSSALHNDAALELLVNAAAPTTSDQVLDVACGPGTVVIAFSRRVDHATGVDATPAMLEQARANARSRGIENVTWRQDDVNDLAVPAASFDIVSCRFAFHHFERPDLALAEMTRVCRPGGRVVVCDGIASDDSAKAAAFNRMEKHRDPSTVAFRPLRHLVELFGPAGLPPPSARFYQVPAERDGLVAMSFPQNDDRDLLRRMIDESVEGDTLGMGSKRDGATVRLAYPAVILASVKP